VIELRTAFEFEISAQKKGSLGKNCPPRLWNFRNIHDQQASKTKELVYLGNREITFCILNVTRLHQSPESLL
jgi:hypothetical protein